MVGQMNQDGSPTAESSAPVRLSRDRFWWLFCLLILVVKLIFLAVDPLPKVFLGDSESYIYTALTGWIPEDRSYFYGFVIRWVALSSESLSPLLILQTALSALVAITISAFAFSTLKFPARLAYALGFLCACDPLQLVWERYVMTEPISLFFYVLALYWSLLYLRDRRLSCLVLVHIFGVLAIGFRMSYLLLTQLNAVILPCVAFLPTVIASFRGSVPWKSRGQSFRLVGTHFLVSFFVMWILHAGYKRANGWLGGTEPVYLVATGSHVLPAWAPIIKPEDAPDARLADIIRHGDEFRIKDLKARNSQHFQPGYLIDRWTKIETNSARANEVAKETALNALQRDPLGVLGLAFKTFISYWNVKELKENARIDLGHVDLKPPSAAILAERFHFAADLQIKDAPLTLLQRYFIASIPYCYFVLLSPILGVLAIWSSRDKRFALFLTLHLGIILGMTLTFTSAPSLRYLQPVSVLTLLCLGICVRAIWFDSARDSRPVQA